MNNNRSYERKCFHTIKGRCFPTETITNGDYADDLIYLANTPAQAESLLHSVEQAAGGFSLYEKSDKAEYMGFNEDGAMSSFKTLKLLDHFIYIGNNISSTENNDNLRIEKAWTAIDREMTIWNSDLSDRIEIGILPICSHIITIE